MWNTEWQWTVYAKLCHGEKCIPVLFTFILNVTGINSYMVEDKKYMYA